MTKELEKSEKKLFTEDKPFLKVFGYKGNDISFIKREGYYLINATQMAHVFGKRPVDWLRLPSTVELISLVEKRFQVSEAKVRKSHNGDNQLVITKKGGNDKSLTGTWMHEDLALDFAQWLDVEFRLWCNDRIKELLNHGFTATSDKIEELVENPDLIIEMAMKLKKEREERALLQAKIDAQAPTIKFVETVFDTNNLVDVGEAAKILKLPYGRNTLFSKLRDKGILMKDNEPYQRYVDQGYLVLNEVYVQSLNEVRKKPLFTQKGLKWLSGVLDK